MRLNLSSQIVLNKVPVEFYKPKTTVEYSEISRMEKIHTDIFASMAEGASHVADGIEAGIKAAQHEGKFYVMALGTGSSLIAVYEELIRRYQTKRLSFRNVVVFNAYEYYPLQKDSSIRSINQLKEHFLDHIDIEEQNIFTLDGFVAQESVQDCCRLYEQRIKSFGGLDIALIGIGRSGNIAANEPGSSIQSMTRIILIGNISRKEMEASEKTKETIPPCSLTMGIATLLSAKTVYLTAWGEEKAEIMQAFVAGSIDILVSTTVIEVGVDVPNAALMIVENADRFGLSQLHQLRGRVGRGEHKSYCVLVSDSDNEATQARLRIMTKTNDGFKISEEDLKLRGPGDFFGSRQHGLPAMHVADLCSDMNVLQTAQQAAQDLLASDPELAAPEHAQLKMAVDRLFTLNADTLN